ncbi:MAG: transketolase C-terminal domain-containing protein [Bacillota bacterium]
MRLITYGQAISEAMHEEMIRDQAVFIMGEDMGVMGSVFGLTRGFMEEFGPWRVIDTPISENSFTAMAVGAAMRGLRPVVEIILAPLDWDTIENSIKKTHRAVIVHEAVKRGGFGGELAAQISEELFDYLDAPVKRVAGLNVILPFSPALEDLAYPNVNDIVAGVKEQIG